MRLWALCQTSFSIKNALTVKKTFKKSIFMR